MIHCEGTWSNDLCPQLVRLAFFVVAKFRDSFFSSRKKNVYKVQTENDHHVPHVWVFSISVNKEEFLNPKVKFRRAQKTAIQPSNQPRVSNERSSAKERKMYILLCLIPARTLTWATAMTGWGSTSPSGAVRKPETVGRDHRRSECLCDQLGLGRS